MKLDIGKILNIKEKNKKNIIIGGLVLVLAVFITTDLFKLKLIEGQQGQDPSILQTNPGDSNIDPHKMLDSISSSGAIPDDYIYDVSQQVDAVINEREQKQCSESQLATWRATCPDQKAAWENIKNGGGSLDDDSYFNAHKNYYLCKFKDDSDAYKHYNTYKNYMIRIYYKRKAYDEYISRKKKFDELKNKLIQKRDYLDTINDYYNSLQGQPHKSISGDFRPDNVDMRHSYYEDEKVDELQWWSNLLTIIFFIIFAIIAVYLLGFQKLYKDIKTWAILVVCVLYFFFFVNLLMPILTAIKWITIKVLPTDIYDKINID